MQETILRKINNHINIDYVELINQSHLHRGHEGAGEETHFLLKIKTGDFVGLSLIKSHKIINNILKDEFNKGLHALSIKIIK